MIQLSSLTGVPLYRQIVHQIKQMAASAILKPGDRLPSVRKLAVELKVNTLTVAKAYSRLAAEGVIQTRPCKGVFLAGGGSPLSFAARRKRLAQAADQFIAEAYRLDIAANEAADLLRERLAEHAAFGVRAGPAASAPRRQAEREDEEDVSVL